MSLLYLVWGMQQPVSAAERMLLTVIGDKADDDGHAEIDQENLPMLTGMGASELYDALERLQADDFLEYLIDGDPELPDPIFVIVDLRMLNRSPTENQTVSAERLICRPKPDRPKQLVYVIEVVDDCGCKIGISQNVENRLRNLQRTCGKTLRIHATFPFDNARKVEMAAHAHFHKHRIYGEWFMLSPAAAASYLSSVLEPQL